MWVENRRIEWDKRVTRIDAEILVKISRDNILAGRSPRLNRWLKQADPTITKRRH